MPGVLPKAFAIDVQDTSGAWQCMHAMEKNDRRLVILPLQGQANAVRLVPLATWGGDQIHVMAFEVA